MRAVVVQKLGDPGVLTIGSADQPFPRSGQVRVRVRTVGVNFTEVARRSGVFGITALPWIPGHEGAGVVEMVGPDVDPSWLGRRVAFWDANSSGTYAEYACASAETLFHLADGIDFAIAVALPTQGLTAFGLCNVATQLLPGQSALVHAAAGGVGALLVQLLVDRGVRVYGTASSPEKRSLVEKMGAVSFSYGANLPELIREHNANRGVDAVFDSVGRVTQKVSMAALAPQGHLVYFGESSGSPLPIHPDELYDLSLKVSSFWLATEPPTFWSSARRELQDMVLRGKLLVNICQNFALEQACQAHELLEQRKTTGKLVLTV